MPAYAPTEIGIDPESPPRPKYCGPLQASSTRPTTLGEGRVLRAITVAATGDVEHFKSALGKALLDERPPREHVLTIRDCELSPRAITASRGDTLKLVNEDDYPFMPRVVGRAFHQVLLRGGPQTIPLDRGGTQAITCGLGATCGRADIVVLHHPVHAVTDAAGTFRLTRVPAGKEVVLHAWHPLFEEATAKVTVAAGQTAKVEIAMRPESSRRRTEQPAAGEPESAPSQSKTSQAEPSQAEPSQAKASQR